MPYNPAGFTALAALVALPAIGLAPITTKYRIDQSLFQEIDATAAGGAKQVISFTTSSFITVTLADSGGGKIHAGGHRFVEGGQRHADTRCGAR